MEEERHAESVVAANEAASIWRSLQGSEPEAVEPLMDCLQVEKSCLIEQGELEQSLIVSDELIKLLREHQAPLESLCEALARRTVVLLELDRPLEAIASGEEATEGWRMLAEADPAVWEPHLAASLSDQAAALLDAGQLSDAETAAIEAMELWTGLAEEMPELGEEVVDSVQTLNRIRAALGSN